MAPVNNKNTSRGVKRKHNSLYILPVTGAEFVILLGMRKFYDVKIKTLPFDYL